MKTTVIFSLLAALMLTAHAERAPENLRVLNGEYPPVFFFRGCEGWSARKDADWDQWNGEYSRLMGIMGKCLDEEVLKREAKNPEWFSRFKDSHPEQSVLLHFNGNARDPRHGTEKYFAGHWVYRKAVKILADVPAEPGESVIRVENASGFNVNMGRYRSSNDDIALFGMTADGKHDWNYCEQVQLISVDKKQNTITVRRGCYGTKPLAFKSGQSRAAAHAVEGPWGRNNNIMWFYNFSTHCPLDSEGKSCSDRLVDDLARWYGKGGKLEKFDGLEFDVLHNVTHGDTTGDGEQDDGVVDGINAYGIGVMNFCRKLRKRLGPKTVIQADGALGAGGIRSQRANRWLNGIESEGWPNLRDWDFDDWSGGINRHYFWHANSFKPAYTYINHKWIEPVPGKPGVTRHPQVPFARHRLSFAGAQFTDSVLTYSFAPPKAKGRGIGIWDELNCGVDNSLGWLGKAVGPTVSLAKQSPDQLKGKDLAKRISGDVNVKSTAAGVLVSARQGSFDTLSFTLRDVPAYGHELTVFANMSARPRRGYPVDMPRFAELAVSGGSVNLMAGGNRGVERGYCARGKAEQELDTSTGASLRYQRLVKIGERSMGAFTLHPPYKGCKGYVFWQRDIDLAGRDYDLSFFLGMSAKAPSRSDGIWYKVLVAEVAGDKVGEFKQVYEQMTKSHEWIPCRVSLKQWSGKKVRLKFVADCGPKDNSTTDQGYWGDVKLVRAGVDEAKITSSKSYMTWLNKRPFEASFYYRDIRSGLVDLTFTVEGSAPVLIKKISVHAAPDARCRVFENGVVLGNPSHGKYTFDLHKIAHGMKLRRIKATPLQDAEVNNGRRVGRAVTLGPLDGLFLKREE